MHHSWLLRSGESSTAPVGGRVVLKLVRTRAVLSLEEASQRANVEVHTLETYESGAALPSKKWVSDLRKSYGVRMSGD